MSIHRYALAAATAALISAFTGTTLRADTTLSFGVVGSPIDLSSNVSEAILPGANGNVFQNSNPLFGTEPNPNQTSELLLRRGQPFVALQPLRRFRIVTRRVER